jgi:predicted membrane channel-forming protein YqfA (hemolysin III family)
MILNNIKTLKNMLLKTWKLILLALIITGVLRYYFGPEFFDLFGLVIFIGLIFIGVWHFYTKKRLPDWVAFSLIVIGLLGILVDGVTSFVLIKKWILNLF